MVNKGTSSSSSKGLPKITGGNGCEFEHYLFKITAEIEIRKHKLMFCVLLRGGVVSALYEMRLLVSSLVSISLNFISLLRVVFMADRLPAKLHGKGVKYETFLSIT